MATIRHQVAIKAPVAKVYAALSTADAVGTWWDRQTPSRTERGVVYAHDPGPEHGIVQLLVVEQAANQRVAWECISTHPASSPASAWTGTRFSFALSEGESPASVAERSCADAVPEHITTLDFQQQDYPDESPYFGFNNFAWAQVLGNLKKVCES